MPLGDAQRCAGGSRCTSRLLSFTALILIFCSSPLPASTKEGEKLLAKGRAAEAKQQYEEALSYYERAYSTDPSDAAYVLGVRRVRFQAGQVHVLAGQKLKQEGKLDRALEEFQKAYAIDPGSDIAAQEMKRTYQLKQKQQKPVAPAAESAAKTAASISDEFLPVPELRPIRGTLATLKINNQPPKVLFDTVGKLAGINVVFDPNFNAGGKNYTVDLSGNTIEQALDYLAVLTKSFWKPLSENTVFVTQDNPTNRRDYEDQVVQVFYLKNVTNAQETTEIATALRTLIDLRRVFVYNSQFAVLVRGTADQVALAGKLIQDMDQPKPEVVVDVLVLETSQGKSREITAALSGSSGYGLSLPVGFTPRNPVSSSSSSSTSTSTASTSNVISLSQLGRVSSADFSTSLPNAVLNLIASDRETRILQRPQVRAAEGQKASLKIGQRIPYATGSFNTGTYGTNGTTTSPLLSTQFQYADVGVNVDMTPKIHAPDEISLHIEIDVSSVADHVDIGGISQPVIGQRKIVHDIRIRDGEASILAGLAQTQDTHTASGIPGLINIPVLRNLLASRTNDKSQSDLLIALVPHIVRTSDVTDANLRPIAVGSDQNVKLTRVPRAEEPAVAADASAAAEHPATPALPSANPTLLLRPSDSRLSVGATLSLDIAVSTPLNLAEAHLRLLYPSDLLILEDVTARPNPSGATLTKDVRNDSGEASLTLKGIPPQAGTTQLLHCVFRARAVGNASIKATDIRLQPSSGSGLLLEDRAATTTIR